MNLFPMQVLTSRIGWKRIFAFPWHTLFIGLYGPVALGAHNIGQISITTIYRPMILSGLLAFLILCLCWSFLRNREVAGIIATVLIILFLSYGHLYNLLDGAKVGGMLIGRHRYLVMAWLLMAGLGSWWAIRKSANFGSLTTSLNLMTFVLLAMPVAQLLFYEARSVPVQSPDELPSQSVNEPVRVGQARAHQPPDVYYIILDAYGRSDILLNTIGYDNSAFLAQLKAMGFYVAACAQSNYSKTDLSLSSSLNMDYVTNLDPALTPENTDRLPLWNLIKENQVQRKFQAEGYTAIAFETGFYFSQLNHLDSFYSPKRKGLNEFEILYMRTTILRLLDDAGWLASLHYTPEDRKRDLILFDLKTLEELPSMPGPKFVFAHLVIPHQPFVFGPDGEPLVITEKMYKGQTYYTEADYRSGYANQVAFISDRIAQVVKKIIENSSTPPIIIIQGDHGPSHYDKPTRMGILNAYYFPGAQVDLYSTITPVNSFRFLFNTYLGENLNLLEDVSYYSEYPEAYQFEIIPNQCQAKVP